MKQMSTLCGAVAENDMSEIKKMVETNKVDPKYGDYDLRTPLHIAASLNNLEMIQYLISKGAVNSLDKFGTFPVQNATDAKCIEALKQAKTVYSDAVLQHEFGQQFVEVMNILMASKEYSFSAVTEEIYGF
jgi:ankyrin repeat protein